MTQQNPYILIVDDIADNREILARRLERRGYRTAQAEDGPTALRMVAAQAFDLVLLDVMMPGMDGIEVLTRLREHHTQTTLPVIMATAKNEGRDVQEALSLGANDYVTKPIDFTVVQARIETQLTRRQAEEALHETNSELERRVAERTAELTEMNKRLQAEIKEKERSEACIRHMAHHDALTGLPNRVLFRDRLAMAIAQAKRSGKSVGVVCLDLDRFKEVNDTLGHPVGDQLLRAVAERLSAVTRHMDTFARLGGDEFAVIVTGIDAPQSTLGPIAERLAFAFEEPFLLGGHSLRSGTSLGIAVYPGDGEDPDDLLKSADTALYSAKSAGRAGYRFFESGMNLALEKRRGLERDMRQAVEREEFVLHYQPLVDLSSGAFVGCEALIRWNRPGHGLVMPGEFIALAEETGMIVEIGEWALNTACREAVGWPERMKIAVNLSPVQFRSRNLVDHVCRALETSGLAPDRLELEITESALLGNTEDIIASLGALRALGVKICMDDFGTGYSSLGYLLKFPFDKIKIDKSFVDDLGTSHSSMAIVRAVIGLAAGLGVTALAEGVEMEAQNLSLRQEGCAEGQGYLFGRPQPGADIHRLFAALGADVSALPLIASAIEERGLLRAAG